MGARPLPGTHRQNNVPFVQTSFFQKRERKLTGEHPCDDSSPGKNSPLSVFCWCVLLQRAGGKRFVLAGCCALPWSGVLGTSYSVMVLNWFSPANVLRGGGKVTPITLPRPLTPRDSRGISGMPSRQARTIWKSLALLSGEKNSLGLSNLKKNLVVLSSESLMTHQTVEEEVVPRRVE